MTLEPPVGLPKIRGRPDLLSPPAITFALSHPTCPFTFTFVFILSLRPSLEQVVNQPHRPRSPSSHTPFFLPTKVRPLTRRQPLGSSAQLPPARQAAAGLAVPCSALLLSATADLVHADRPSLSSFTFDERQPTARPSARPSASPCARRAYHPVLDPSSLPPYQRFVGRQAPRASLTRRWLTFDSPPPCCAPLSLPADVAHALQARPARPLPRRKLSSGEELGGAYRRQGRPGRLRLADLCIDSGAFAVDGAAGNLCRGGRPDAAAVASDLALVQQPRDVVRAERGLRAAAAGRWGLVARLAVAGTLRHDAL